MNSPSPLPSQSKDFESRPYRNNAQGNLVIRSSDGVDFHVEKAIIANLSPVFNDMFSIPSPSEGEGKPTVDVTESSRVWDHLLAFCYLLPNETFPTITTIRALLEAAKKYRMSAIRGWMRNTLLQSGYLETEALRTYAVACAYGLEDVALVAARGCLALPEDLDNPTARELEHITALQYTRLGNFRERCAAAATKAIVVTPKDPPQWLSASGAWLGQCKTCLQGRGCASDIVVMRSRLKTKVLVRVRKAWLEYLQALAVRLKKTPEPTVARSADLLGPVIASAHGACAECRTQILEQAMLFSDYLACRIEEAIYEVQLIM